MLDSFIATQKLSVQKALRRKFRRFIVSPADYAALALLRLQECLRDARRVEAVTGVQEDGAHYVVPVRQLEERCRELDILDLQPFFASPTFRDAGFTLSLDRQRVLLARA